MGVGIIEPKHFHGEVTGTIIMSLNHTEDTIGKESIPTTQPSILNTPQDPSHLDNESSNHDIVTLTTLKTTKNGIILHPQPQDNPNDPLNWPLWRRDLALLVLGFHVFIGGGQSAILATGLSGIAKEFHVSPSKNAYLVGAYMLALGVGSLFAAPTAVLYGKRVVYIMGIIIFLGGAIWGAVSKTWGSLLGARILMGIGVSPCESLPSATIAEIYFAHERAYRLGMYTMLLLGGKNIVPMLASFVFQQLSRHWLFWIITIILGINLVLTILFVPETFWERAPTPNKRSLEETEKARIAHEQTLHDITIDHIPNAFALHQSHQNSARNSITSLNSSIVDETQPSANAAPVYGISDPAQNPHDKEAAKIARKSYIESLRIFSGRHTADKWWMVFLRPFVLLIYPPVLFGSFLYTFAIVWLILISETISRIFSKSPYGYSKIIIGLFYISPFIGGTLGSLVAGRLSDILVRIIVKRNNGIYEPEFRLFMCLPVFITVFIGLLGFGWASEVHDMWIGPVLFFGVLGFGCSLASTTAITYTVDSYKIFAAEALVTLNVMKNVVGFLFSLFNNSFVDRKGAKIAFLTFGCIQLFVCLFAIPLYFYGKRTRHWTDEKEFMKFLYTSSNSKIGNEDISISQKSEGQRDDDSSREVKNNDDNVLDDIDNSEDTHVDSQKIENVIESNQTVT